MTKIIDVINNDLIPLLNQKWRKGNYMLASGIAEIIGSIASRDDIKANELNLDNIESESWREHIKKWIGQ